MIEDIQQHQLVYVPHPRLEMPVDEFPLDIELRRSVGAHMQSLLQHYRGAGLAANQINLNLSVHVQMVQTESVTMFNPKILKISNDKVLMSEGCLSDPGLYLKIKRPDIVMVSWEDSQGHTTTETLYGMDARVFLHEFDHLQGILFTDRVGKTKLNMARKKQCGRIERAAQRIMENM